MFIRNKKTGLVQECHNKDVIKVYKKDTENFEVTEKKPKVTAKKAEEEKGAE